MSQIFINRTCSYPYFHTYPRPHTHTHTTENEKELLTFLEAGEGVPWVTFCFSFFCVKIFRCSKV
jgi:hypothetical protein